jgi:7-carboxy-7-deazaguanine synthase
MLNVMEIFHSIDGEGIRAGELTTFIRLAGCNLACKYCDTAYSINPKREAFMKMEVVDIADKVLYQNVTITGGEPLLQSEVVDLCIALSERGISVNVETNGTIVPPEVPNIGDGIFFTVDYKTGCSGHEDKMSARVFQRLSEKDVIKCVVASQQDLENALKNLTEWLPNLGEKNSPWVYFSPVFGKIQPREIVDFMHMNFLTGKFRVQLQLHKIIWDPSAREV